MKCLLAISTHPEWTLTTVSALIMHKKNSGLFKKSFQPFTKKLAYMLALFIEELQRKSFDEHLLGVNLLFILFFLKGGGF